MRQGGQDHLSGNSGSVDWQKKKPQKASSRKPPAQIEKVDVPCRPKPFP